ncbi:hypothetical protein [Agrobacterium tumefaciens]|uniref:hypothetical protein n=1 Tax=Agrobacterium tumefaciens TaxID=358 RepID=UPI0015724ADE|nr:hypothetical protein [Agrobacterium tumefaciens]WCK01550.1 hypothetical protein G6L31_009835 [Agrobacterium tumefaciens]
MTNFKVDLKTRIISDDTRVFLARAGKKGHLFTRVEEAKAIGPDLPDLDLNLTADFIDSDLLDSKIKRSRILKAWLTTSPSSRGGRPPQTLAAYRNVSKSPGHAQIAGIVKGYFVDVKEGDILVIPNPNNFSKAIIAEALPISAGVKKIPGMERFEGYEFDGRKFGYSKLVPMASLPRSVIELTQAPTGFAEIHNAHVKQRIFSLGFDDYIMDSEFAARIITTKPDFKPFDNNVLSALITMVAENIERLQHGASEPDLVGLREAAFLTLDDGDLQVKININSPGSLLVLAKSIAPLVISTILGVLVAVNFDASAFTNSTTIEVTNSRVLGVADVCSAEVQQVTEAMLQFLSSDAEFKKSCALLKQAHAQTGAHSNVDVDVTP